MIIFKKEDAKKLLPRREANSHKGSFGKVLILAGSEGMWGAGLLASASAYRMGCGYVYWASFQNPSAHISAQPEILTDSIDHISDFSKYDAILIGPGLNASSRVQDVLHKLLSHPNVVVDADALTVLSQLKDFKIPATWVLTPHPGEMARLLHISTEEVQVDRLESLKKAQSKFKCVVLLKGHESLIADEKNIYQINSGNSGLAKAGSGDVLGGFIVSLLAQGLKALPAVLLASFVHGALADLWAQTRSERALQSSDLKDLLPEYLKKLEN